LSVGGRNEYSGIGTFEPGTTAPFAESAFCGVPANCLVTNCIKRKMPMLWTAVRRICNYRGQQWPYRCEGFHISKKLTLPPCCSSCRASGIVGRQTIYLCGILNGGGDDSATEATKMLSRNILDGPNRSSPHSVHVPTQCTVFPHQNLPKYTFLYHL
jgi:hypothetical protein